MRIELDIERLTLNGIELNRRQLADLREALVTELTRLLAGSSPGQLAAPANVPTLRAPGIQLGGATSPATVGQSLARSLHRGITGDPGSPGGRAGRDGSR